MPYRYKMSRRTLSIDLSLCFICFIFCTNASSYKTQDEISRKSARLSSKLKNFSDKLSYEVKSPTSLGPLYMNIADGSQVQYDQSPPSATPPLINYGPQAVALGAEEQQPSQVLGHSMIVAAANQINPNEMMMSGQPSSAYNQPLAMLPSDVQANGQQGNVLASIYIDQYGNQQMRVPPGTRVTQSGGEANQEKSDTMNDGFYSHHPVSQHPHAQQSASLYTNRPVPSQAGESQHYNSLPRPFIVGDNDGQSNQAPRFSNELALKPAQSNESLSNAQLMSLIDELKDFNNKQATSGKQKDAAPENNVEDEVQSDDDDIDEDPSNVDTKHSSASEPPKTSQEKVKKRRVGGSEQGRENKRALTDDEEKVSADDLAKFAKFLMTKEGANMRFQLGLDKEAPDDGDLDDDDKDALLESKKRPTGTRRDKSRNKDANADSSQALNELDKKHSEVASQMDYLLENLTGTLNKAAKEEERRRKRRRDRKKSMDMDSDDLKARARRNSENKRPSEKPRARQTIVESDPSVRPSTQGIKHEKGHSDNFAKKLIEKEMMQDKLESNIQSIRQAEKGLPRRGHKMRPDPKEEASVRGLRKRRQGIDVAEVSGGQEDEKYPKRVRKKDHIELLHELQKTRRDRSRNRSEPSKFLNKEPILRQALNGELGMQTESHPDGKLVLTSGRGPSVTVKLPTKKASRIVHADYEGNSPDDGSTSSSTTTKPSSVGDRLNHVKIESDKPFKDEYPISERVSSRLNVLSNNLDRYFNDGFMNEIENRSKIKGQQPGDSKLDNHQAESSNVNETSTEDRGNGPAGGDRDFDVNVGVDGKRDVPESDDDEDDDESESDKSSSKARGKSVIKQKGAEGRVGSEGERSSAVKKSVKAPKLGRKDSIGLARNALKETERHNGRLRQKLSAGERHLSFEDRGDKSAPKLDPVEGEGFDSPIGPDNDNLELLMPPAADKKVESSRESKQVLTRNGKRVNPKFYEEPDW